MHRLTFLFGDTLIGRHPLDNIYHIDNNSPIHVPTYVSLVRPQVHSSRPYPHGMQTPLSQHRVLPTIQFSLQLWNFPQVCNLHNIHLNSMLKTIHSGIMVELNTRTRCLPADSCLCPQFPLLLSRQFHLSKLMPLRCGLLFNLKLMKLLAAYLKWQSLNRNL